MFRNHYPSIYIPKTTIETRIQVTILLTFSPLSPILSLREKLVRQNFHLPPCSTLPPLSHEAPKVRRGFHVAGVTGGCLEDGNNGKVTDKHSKFWRLETNHWNWRFLSSIDKLIVCRELQGVTKKIPTKMSIFHWPSIKNGFPHFKIPDEGKARVPKRGTSSKGPEGSGPQCMVLLCFICVSPPLLMCHLDIIRPRHWAKTPANDFLHSAVGQEFFNGIRHKCTKKWSYKAENLKCLLKSNHTSNSQRMPSNV